jgi:integrase
MFNTAERPGQHQGTNPVRLVRFLPESEQERRLLLGSPPYLRDRILVAINTGLRTSDIFNLEWREVDIEQRRLKKIVKKKHRLLSLLLNDTALGIVEGLGKFTWHMFRHTFASRLTRTMRRSVGRCSARRVVTKQWQSFHGGRRSQYNVVTSTRTR